MKYNTYTLANGLRVIHLPSDSAVVYCGYQIRAGSCDETIGEEGLAHFCEHTTFKGTTRRRAWHVLNCLESVGGDVNAYTNKEDTVFYAAILKEHVERAVDLLSDIVFHSVYPQGEIEKEVEVICDEIESYNDSPAELIYDEFENMVFEGYPLGHNILGNAERVRSYTTADALRFTKKYYHPANAVFFAYGDIDFARLIKLLEKHTKDVEIVAAETPKKAPLPEAKPVKRIVEKGTHQAHVMLGTRSYAIHDDRRIVLYLLNNILGGPGLNAKLNLSLREHNGLVYTVESSMVSYGETGLWSTYFGCDQSNIDKCLRLVRHELDKITNTPLTPQQLAKAKKQIKGQIGVACDNRETFALSFGKSYLHYGWERNVEELYRNIDDVTAERIQQVAADLFSPENLFTLIYR